MTIYEIVSDYGYGDKYIHETFQDKNDAIEWCLTHDYVGFNLSDLFSSDLIHHIDTRYIE